MNDFAFHIPTKMFFGKDCLSKLNSEMKSFGKRVLIVYGGGSVIRTGLMDRIKELLQDDFELFEHGGIEPNPKIGSIRKGAEKCKENSIDIVLAVGGGSVIDASKAIAAGACVDFDPWEFYGGPRKPIEKALPLFTIVTMASTGSEMTCGAVISNDETREKLGRGGFPVFPKASFLDPELTYSVPPFQTACGAADILSHVMESYFKKDVDFSLLDRMMEGVMKAVIANAKIALAEPENYEARGNLMWAASWAINGLFGGGSRQVWSCHPIEHELSARYDMTHGLGLAIITPKWLRYCMETDPETRTKVREFGANVFGTADENEAVESLENFLYNELGLVSTLDEAGIEDPDTEDMAAAICKKSDINGFIPLDKKAVQEILEACRKKGAKR
ncbi:MAG: iron-containing alcohol dehydrogenase [Mogibacterium sp.]|nr:iron-containing alcohol dehydrogenase [Mogibacterium sp.]